jgi:hypothetical protein
MREMNRDQMVASPLQELTSAATDFGLSSGEVLEAMDEALHLTGTDVLVSEYLDGLSGLLARRILMKERDMRSDPA